MSVFSREPGDVWEENWRWAPRVGSADRRFPGWARVEAVRPGVPRLGGRAFFVVTLRRVLADEEAVLDVLAS